MTRSRTDKTSPVASRSAASYPQHPHRARSGSTTAPTVLCQKTPWCLVTHGAASRGASSRIRVASPQRSSSTVEEPSTSPATRTRCTPLGTTSWTTRTAAPSMPTAITLRIP
ncbi:hypothetical protein JKF63_04788 [Porcisia hertigi]|uniref:Uncharacterized protein n=1 Tax=Porcisia hertigi TaxID=2761500 RepID=A0A836I7H3_9TRYP|nr:hypothetical protein JKF63_04788 [Porcisia hertigi]